MPTPVMAKGTLEGLDSLEGELSARTRRARCYVGRDTGMDSESCSSLTGPLVSSAQSILETLSFSAIAAAA